MTLITFLYFAIFLIFTLFFAELMLTHCAYVFHTDFAYILGDFLKTGQTPGHMYNQGYVQRWKPQQPLRSISQLTEESSNIH